MAGWRDGGMLYRNPNTLRVLGINSIIFVKVPPGYAPGAPASKAGEFTDYSTEPITLGVIGRDFTDAGNSLLQREC